MFYKASRALFRATNRFANQFGILLSKPSVIHGSPAFSGATLWARRLNQTKFFFDLIKDVKGDIVESGVHWGYGLLIELTLTEKNMQRKIYAFDSFAGHSTPHSNDFSGGKYKPLGDSFKISESDVWKTLELGIGKSKDVLCKDVELIHGWLQETMPIFRKMAQKNNIHLALVHADCDIYEPFKATLENTWDALAVNGVVILGRLNNSELLGKTKAVEEFLLTRNSNEFELCETFVQDNDLKLVKQSYLIKRGL